MSKPWLEHGPAAALPEIDVTGMPTAKIGLGVFLAVVGCLFALFASAYFMRMELSDWQPLPIPRLLWLNTGVLVLSSVALQCAVVAARRGQIDMVRLGLVTSGFTDARFSRRATRGVAGAFSKRLSPRRQSGQQLFLHDHRHARPAHCRRPGGARPDDGGRLGKILAPTGCGSASNCAPCTGISCSSSGSPSSCFWPAGPPTSSTFADNC